jgi:CDGSH-type Zn-finger protein/truncated hemoglobin YjbI
MTEIDDLLTAAAALATTTDESTATRLQRSVIRPLRTIAPAAGQDTPAAGVLAAGDDTPAAVAPAADLFDLALAATRARSSAGASPALAEATAALQQLAAADAPERAPELAAPLAGLATSVQLMPRGPLLVVNPPAIRDHLGVDVPTVPQMALCRCGRSAHKPLCDGSHADADGFDDAKDPARLPDRRDEYDGLRVTIVDNRGLCAHSAFCSDRVATVFRVGAEPWIAPSGGRMDEILGAVRSCPSGALSVALDGVEDRTMVDTDREPAIEISQDGPYRLTGGIPVLDGDGEPVPRNAGASPEHCSLCRCGSSQNKPFCSGRHWDTHFSDPPMSDEPTLFEWAGGFPALERMTKLFYGKHVPADDLLAPRFASMSPDHPQRVAAWLGETFGGPKRYLQRYGGYDRMLSQHIGRSLTEAERSRWVTLLARSADEAGLPRDPEFRAAFTGYLEWGSRIAVENSTPGAHPPEHMPDPHWWWVCEATPWTRRSALAPVEERPEAGFPVDDAQLRFAEHIKPLFRHMDRDSMKFVFDLWEHEDVAEHADAILERLRAGTMPCDGAWPRDWVDGFERWVRAGAPA